MEEELCALAKTDPGPARLFLFAWWLQGRVPLSHVRVSCTVIGGCTGQAPLSPQGHQSRARQVTPVIMSSSAMSGLQPLPLMLRGWTWREDAPQETEEHDQTAEALAPGRPDTVLVLSFPNPWTRLL